MKRRSLPLTILSAALLAAGAHAIQATPIPALPPAQMSPSSPVPGTEILPEIPPVSPTAPTTPRAPSSTTSTATTPPTVSNLFLPTDPLFPRQWDMSAIHLPEAWKLWKSVPNPVPVTVAVLDTGFVASPELAGRVVNGYDFVSNSTRAGDGNGRDPDASPVGQYSYHGEVVANLIAAAHDGRGMAGINPQAKIVQVRVAATDGTIELQDLIDAMKWAVGLPVAGVPANPNPAKLLNLSLYVDYDGYPKALPLTGCDHRLQDAINAVTAKGALVIAGAANDGADAGGYSPAGCRNVLTVTSVSQTGARPAYANWGRSVTLAAPGGEPGHGILSSSLSGPGGERTPDGTSFAAPHVTGVASLILSVRPKLSPLLLKSLLTRTATPFPAGRCDPIPAHTCGAGNLNAEAALKSALASSVGK